MEIIEDESGILLKVAGVLDIGTSAEFQKALCSGLAGKPGLALDLSGVEACDLTALQLLCSAGKTAQQAGKSYELRSFSEAVANAAAALGLSIDQLSCLAAGAGQESKEGAAHAV